MRYVILPLLLVSLTAGLSLGQISNDASIVDNNSSTGADVALDAALTLNENTSLNVTENVTMNATENVTATAVDVTSAVTGPNLNYIWSLTGVEAGPITMVLNQSGSDLIGRAKYEPDSGSSWNADVIGTVAADKVDLTMSAQKDNIPTITRLSGIFANEAISGNFTQVSEGKIVNNGTFNAMWINPDTSSYAPATVEAPAAAVAPAATVANMTTATETAEVEEESRFVDVRSYADKIGPGGDLSGIPPGMSGF